MPTPWRFIAAPDSGRASSNSRSISPPWSPRRTAKSITAWDFFEYGPYTTEPVPRPGDRTTQMQWFWEPVHFKRTLGEVMSGRLFSGKPENFGVELTAATVDARNEHVRDQQRAFEGWRLACETNRQTRCQVPDSASAEASR